MTPLDTREWLEGLYAAGGPDADRAREALELIDAAQDDADELELWRQLDVDDVREARQHVDAAKDLRDLMEEAELIDSETPISHPQIFPVLRMFLPV